MKCTWQKQGKLKKINFKSTNSTTPSYPRIVPVFYCATYNKKFKEKVNFTAPDLTHTCDPNKYCGNYPLCSHRHVIWFKKKGIFEDKNF